MPNTFSQIYIQAVFAVQGRQSLIRKENNEELLNYMTGIVQNQGQKLLAAHCMPDHTHIFFGLKPSMSISHLVKEVKADSTNFVNRQRWFSGRFSWQEGYGAFSYGHSQIGQVIRYVQNQEEHHAQRTFRQEYLSFLKKFNIPYEEKYLFDFGDEESSGKGKP